MVATVVSFNLRDSPCSRLVRALHVLAAVLNDKAFEERMEFRGDLAGLLDQRVHVGERGRLLGRWLFARGERGASSELRKNLEQPCLVALVARGDESAPLL